MPVTLSTPPDAAEAVVDSAADSAGGESLTEELAAHEMAAHRASAARPHSPASPTDTAHRIEMLELRRSRGSWRQRLIDAEQGFRFGLRSESTLYATLFAVLAIGAAAIVLGVSALEAAVLVVALTQSVACTFMRLIVKEATGPRSTAQRLAAAAALASAAGGLAVTGLLLGPKITGGW